MLRVIAALDNVSSGESPSIKPGISPSDVGPGFLGFLFTFFVVAVMAALIVDMVRRVRRVRYRSQLVEADRAAEQTGAGRPVLADGLLERDMTGSAAGEQEGANPGQAGPKQ